MLKELSKQDQKWRQIALNICKDKTLADELTQEMYLRIAAYKNKIKNPTYFIATVLLNLYKNHVSKNKEVLKDNLDYIESEENSFEPTDAQQVILDRIELLPWIQKELLAESYDRSLRGIEKQYNINYGFSWRQIKESKQTVLNG